MKKTVGIIAVIIGCLIYSGFSYSQTSAQGGEGGKSGAAGSSGQGGKGGDGTVIIGNQSSTGGPAGQPTPAKDDPKVDVEQIKRLIKDLDADDIAVRDKATDELKKTGKPALSYLEESAKSESPEVAWRSKIIINAIKKAEQKNEPQPDAPVSRKIGPTIRQFGNNFSITLQGATPGTRSFSMSQDGSGKIAVNIIEYDKDGKQNTKTYEANSTEEFKQKYPEIAKEYGIGENPKTTIEIPDFDFDDIFKDLGRSWDKRLEDEVNRLKDMFNKKGNQSPKTSRPEAEDEDSLPPRSTTLTTTDLGFSMEETDKELLINNVELNGLGAQIGLKKGDVIVSVNGVVVDNLWQCRRQIKTALAKGRVSLVVIRENKKETLIYPK